MRKLIITALSILGIWLLLTVTGCNIQRSFVWPMSAEEVVDRPVPPNATLVWVNSGDSQVEAWFFPAPDNLDGKKHPAVMFFHGNNEVIDHCLEFAERYAANGISTMLVEYRGYGRSTGTPAMQLIRSDMIAFYDWLAKQPLVDSEKIVFHGRSIGGAVAADLSQHRKPAAMILSSTFTSMEVMFWRFGVPGFIVEDKYRTEDVMRDAEFPVLVQHGTRDDIIPVKDGRELGSLGKQTKYIEYDANHDLPTNWSTFEAHIIEFLAEYRIVNHPLPHKPDARHGS